MSTAKTTIELNGKLYDAKSGRVISDMVSKPAPVVSLSNHSADYAVMDGVVSRTSVPVSKVNTELQPSFHTSVAKTKPGVARTNPAHIKTKIQKSKTLMRPAVKKPKPTVQNDVSSSRASIVKKTNPARHVRAATVNKSNHIQRFSTVKKPTVIIKKQVALPVVAQASTSNTQIVHLAKSTEDHVRQSVDIIEESLRQASSHLEIFEDRIQKGFWHRVGFRNKAANLATAGIAGFMLFGFFTYQNIPNVEMRVAATRAGVPAQMPGYSPAGFSASRAIKSEPGKVAVTFQSNTDDKQFTVTQQTSNWSSDSLLSNHVVASKKPYQTYQDAGKTVYIQDNSNATWVNGGVWYKVEGNASLTSDQLLRIANSL